MLTAKQLVTICARCDAATAGPWSWGLSDIPRMPYTSGYLKAKNGGLVLTAGPTWSLPIDALSVDIQFISHARTDVPALLKEIERLQKLLLAHLEHSQLTKGA